MAGWRATCHGKFWELRTELDIGWSRLFFVIDNGKMFLLHGVLKKSRKVSKDDLEVTETRYRLLLQQQQVLLQQQKRHKIRRDKKYHGK
jgi:phage-related protein